MTREGKQAAIEELHPARLLELCRTSHLGRTVVLCDETRSTNAVAMSAAAGGAPEGLLVVAEAQSMGRGRKGRAWRSVRGKSLTCSLLLRPTRSGGGITAVYALAVTDALAGFVGSLAVKWPNDILCSGKKLGGILAESIEGAVVIGLGLNVNETRADLPPGIVGEAISLRMAAKKRFDRGLVLCRILEAFEKRYEGFERGGFAPVRREMEERLVGVGGRVIIEDGHDTLEGTMIGVTDEGYLRLEVDGSERVFSAGDLTLRVKPPRE